jgi:uncharacterized protein YjiK
MRTVAATLLLGGLCAIVACRPTASEAMSGADSATVARRVARLEKALAQPDSGGANGEAIAKWILGKDLTEISGLALTGDGRLFAHADEGGQVFEVDYRSGRMVDQFAVGEKVVVADFEGITTVGDTLFLLASNGMLYQFLEGSNGDRVNYATHDTGLKDACEFEGIAFDSTIGSMLLLCKNVLTKGPLQDSLVIYRWRPSSGSDSGSAAEPSRLTVPLAPIIGPNGWKNLHPSDITIDPTDGNYVMVAADERALIEITPSGELISARPLGPGLAHAEGVAITKDGILIISTEGRPKVSAALSLFRWH